MIQEEDDEEDEMPTTNNRRSVPVTAPGVKRDDPLLGNPIELQGINSQTASIKGHGDMTTPHPIITTPELASLEHLEKSDTPKFEQS